MLMWASDCARGCRHDATGGPFVLKQAPTRILPSGFIARSSRLSLRRFGPDRQIPVVDLRAGPEQHVRLLADVLEDLAEIFQPMRRPHDVGVHHQGLYPGAVLGVGIYLLELIHGAVVILR